MSRPEPALLVDVDLEGAAPWHPREEAAPASVNAAGLELIHQLERAGDRLAREYRAQLSRAIRSSDAARLAGSVTYHLPRWSGDPSLDTRQQTRRPPRRTLNPGQRARQRDRYKRAGADALEAFARLHQRRDPRAGILRPRWLDHRPSCHRGYCGGCAGIPVPAGPRWHRRGRRSDYLNARTLSVAEWLFDRSVALRTCRDAVALVDRACGGHLVIPQSCHVRTCPDCEAARQTRVVEAYAGAVAALDPERCRFLTLTLRNLARDELAAGMAALSAALVKLKRRAIWRGGRCRPGPCRSCGERRRDHDPRAEGNQCLEYLPRCRMPADPARPGMQLPHDPVTAEMTSLEVTYNRAAKSWHPHAHSILEGPFIDQAELSELWAELTGAPVVWIESVRRHADAHWAGDTRAALRELLKYAAKPSPAFLEQRDPEILAELLVALRGRHLTSTAGALRGLDPDGTLEPVDPRLCPPGPSCSLLVLVQPDNDEAEPYRAPRTCPLHGGEADWRVHGYVPRSDCRPAPARAGPLRAVLSWDPRGAVQRAELHPVDGAPRRQAERLEL